MVINRKGLGYTAYSRIEDSLRSWLAEKLLTIFGAEWHAQVPEGIWKRALDALELLEPAQVEHPLNLLEETTLPDLMEIVCHRKQFGSFVARQDFSADEFRDLFLRLYLIRNKIAHVKRTFSAVDLDILIEGATRIAKILGKHATELNETLECLKTNPESVVLSIPPTFYVSEEDIVQPRTSNLPPADYAPDGGFIGRKEDLSRVEALLLGEVHRVVTVSGAGGVGKSALAHQVCANLLKKEIPAFDAIVWVSAKEEKLTVTGIESIEPTFRNFEQVLNSILETFGWLDDLDSPTEKKLESVEVILKAGDKGILLVVDNLETIRDEQVKEFIKDLPPPSKVLITSRVGLGEVERRYPLKEMTGKDAVVLLRTVAHEKGLDTLVQMPDSVLSTYVDRMSRYPLAIKWVLGQVAIGKDINIAMGDLTSSSGDVARFCFDHIFVNLLDESSRLVMYVLAASENSLPRGVIAHLSGMQDEELDRSIQKLTVASLVIPSQLKSSEGGIETRYALLPLTRNYVFTKLQAHNDLYQTIKSKIAHVQNLIEEAERAGRTYRYSLRDMGAESDEEKIAATWAMNAYQQFQSGNYDGAISSLNKAAQIAPHFAAIYRNWATIESDAGFHQKADELMRKASTLAPGDPRVWFVWSNIEKRRNRYDRACEYLQKANKLSPEDGFLMAALGDVEKRRGNYELANNLMLRSIDYRAPGTEGRRHQLICLTSLADNLRRWAQALEKDSRSDEALQKLAEARTYAVRACELSRDDMKALDVFREINLDIAFHLWRHGDFQNAKRHFEEISSQRPKRIRERKFTEAACYSLAVILLDEGKTEDARKWFFIGKKAMIEGGKYSDRYKSLMAEFTQERTKGKMIKVFALKGFGFIETKEEPPRQVFIHISQIIPAIANSEFDSLIGSSCTFFVEKTDKGPEARRVRFLR
jgi:tetratricopeptide (TPR) repeat protein/cold shock CspA family protein